MRRGLNLTKDLGNLPPNICTPTYLANQSKKIAKDYKMKSTILNLKQMTAIENGVLSYQLPKEVEKSQNLLLWNIKKAKNQKNLLY